MISAEKKVSSEGLFAKIRKCTDMGFLERFATITGFGWHQFGFTQSAVYLDRNIGWITGIEYGQQLVVILFLKGSVL